MRCFIVILMLVLNLNCFGSIWTSYQWYDFDWCEREKRFVKILEHLEKSKNEFNRRVLLLNLSVEADLLVDFVKDYEEKTLVGKSDDETKRRIEIHQLIIKQIKEIQTLAWASYL